jgi:hypothetical protein
MASPNRAHLRLCPSNSSQTVWVAPSSDASLELAASGYKREAGRHFPWTALA